MPSQIIILSGHSCLYVRIEVASGDATVILNLFLTQEGVQLLNHFFLRLNDVSVLLILKLK
jgi:hypothetical protein